MKSDGKQLEALVSYVEKSLIPQGFDVKTNERVYNDEGAQVAEFDVEVRGKIGSTRLAWLIECRDRPSQGPAPGSWIEQLVGRRIRFGFNKVTAVSTTGFAEGVFDFAKREGIELREVKSLEPEELTKWLAMSQFVFVRHVTKLEHATLLVKEGEPEERRVALENLMSTLTQQSQLLKSTKTGEFVTAGQAFLGAVSGVGTLFEDLSLDNPSKNLRLHAQYPDDKDHFIVETNAGPIRIADILFVGELYYQETLLPLSTTAEYREMSTGEIISQVASFAPFMVNQDKLSLEMHHLGESGETHVTLRKVG